MILLTWMGTQDEGQAQSPTNCEPFDMITGSPKKAGTELREVAATPFGLGTALRKQHSPYFASHGGNFGARGDSRRVLILSEIPTAHRSRLPKIVFNTTPASRDDSC